MLSEGVIKRSRTHINKTMKEYIILKRSVRNETDFIYFAVNRMIRRNINVMWCERDQVAMIKKKIIIFILNEVSLSR